MAQYTFDQYREAIKSGSLDSSETQALYKKYPILQYEKSDIQNALKNNIFDTNESQIIASEFPDLFPKVDPITKAENEPTPITDTLVGLNRGIESMGEAIAAPVQRLFSAPPNQDAVVPEELDLGSMQAVRDRQAMIPPKAPVEPGYVPPAGIAEGLEAALPIAYQGTKKGIAGAVQALAENMPVTSFPTAPIAEYMQGVGKGAQAEIEKTMQEKQIRPGTAGAVATDVAASMAQFLPIAGMSIIAPSVAPAGLAFLATVSGGDKYQRAKEAGFGEGEALAQGIAYGAAEAIGEKIGLDYLLTAAKNPAVMSGVKTIFAQGLKQAGVEGAEEGLTQIIQNATDIVAKKARPETKGEAPGLLQDVPYAMGVGAVAGGVTGGGLGALQSMLGQQQAPQTEAEASKEEVKPEEPIRETPTATEPAPQNMEQTTEFLTRKPAVTIGEAERLQGEAIPEGRGGMTIGPRRPAVTFGDEGERTGEAIPESKGMTVQPTAPTNKLDQLFKREPSTTSPEPQQATEVAPEDITPQPVLETQSKTPEIITNQKGEKYIIEPEIEYLERRYTPVKTPNGATILMNDIELNQLKESPENYEKLHTQTPKPSQENVTEQQPQISSFEKIQNAYGMTGEEAIKQGYIIKEAHIGKNGKDVLDGYSASNGSTIYKSKEKALEAFVNNGGQFRQPAEPTAVKTPDVKESEIFTDEEIAKKKTYIQRLNDEFEQKQKENKERAAKRIPVKSFEYGDKPTENKYYRILMANENIDAKEGFEIVEDAKPFKVKDVEGDYFIVKEQNNDYQKRSIHARFPKTKMLYSVSDAETGYKILSVPTVKEATEKLKEIFDSGKLRKAIDEMIKSKGRSPRYDKSKSTQPRPKSGPGMFGGATVQNAYEKVDPTLKKGADMLFKKGKQAYETVKRNADITRDMGRVVDITEKEGRPVETEAPIRSRIGLFNLQNVYEKIVGKPRTSDDRITVGDPTIGKKINDMYDRTNQTEMKIKQEAEGKRQTVSSATRQSLIDLFSPYLDIAKKDSKRYEKVMAKLHDVFYIPSAVEGFLNDYRDQILEPVKKAGKTYRDYSAYRMAKWTLTGREKVKSPLSLKEAQDFVDSIDPQTRKLFEDITTDFHEKTWKPLLQQLEDSGLKDDKVIKFIMDKENYATFFPAKQMGLSYGSREYKPSGEIFKLTEEGYTGDIQDVLTSLMQKGISMLTHANINMAKVEGLNLLKDMSPSDIVLAKQSFKGVRKVKDSNGNEIEMPIVEFDEPATGSQMALLTVRENGKAKGYYVPKQFAEAFDNALGDPSSFADAVRYYSNLTQAIKNVWIDYNPPWQLFTNMVRDIPAAAIEMPGFKKPIKFVGKVVKKAPAAIGDYVKFVGEVGQQITGYDRKAFEKQVTQLLKEKKLLSSKDVQHLGDYSITVFDRIQNAFDSFPKDGESQSFLQQMKAFGKDIERLTKVAFEETLAESGEFTPEEITNMTRRGGSPAFGVRGGGKAFEAIKVPLMFYNAVKEGWRAGKYFYQKDPAGFLIKAAVPLSIFSFGAAAAAGAFGDEWKKAYLAIKKSDRENKLVYPLWWTDEGNIKYLALSVPQFLKPFMIMINELASSNPSLAEGLADAMSNEMPSLNPVLDITKTLTSYGGNKPPIDRFGNPIMTQDQWTAGGSEKALALLKSISNQNLFGSLFKFPVKPTDPKKDFVTSLYDVTFGKIMKESFAPAIDTEEQDVNAAKARLLARQIIEIEKENPEEANRLRNEMRKLGYIPSRQFMRSVRREANIEKEKEAGTITDREAYEKRLRQQPKAKRKKYNELFKK